MGAQLKNWVKTWNEFLTKCTQSIKDYIQKEEEFWVNNIPDKSIILDAGCGFGRVIKLLATKAEKIYGIDVNNEIIEEAKKFTKDFENVELSKDNFIKTHFPDSYFDCCIFGMNTFGDLDKDKIPALKEATRVTKPNGKIFISVYSENALEDRLKSYRKIADFRVIDKEKGIIKIYTTFDGVRSVIAEQFSKEYLIDLCRKVNQDDVVIRRLNDISYICTINVKKIVFRQAHQ